MAPPLPSPEADGPGNQTLQTVTPASRRHRLPPDGNDVPAALRPHRTQQSTTIAPTTGQVNPHQNTTDYCLRTYGGIELMYIRILRIYYGHAHDLSFRKQTAILQKKSSLSRIQGGGNMVLFMLRNLTYSPYSKGKQGTYCDRHNNTITFVLGVDQSGTDSKGLIKLTLLNPPPPPTTTSAPKTDPAPTYPTSVHSQGGVTVFDLENVDPQEMLALATGYQDNNLWIEWLLATVGSVGMTDCAACASARPLLITTPVQINPSQDPNGFHCLLVMNMSPHPANCSLLSNLFPPGLNETTPPLYTVTIGNYTCLIKRHHTSRSCPSIMVCAHC